jgi:hypothetical protein
MKITVQKEVREEIEVKLPLYLDLGESDDLSWEYRKITKDKTIILTKGWSSIELTVLNCTPVIKEHWLKCQTTEEEWNNLLQDAKEFVELL